MATKKLTEKQLYKAKVEWFQEHEYEEVDPLDFYREIFPVGSFQEQGNTERKAGNGMLIYKNEEGQHWHKFIFDDLAEIPNWYGKEDVYIRSASFIGKRSKNENASMIYALVFDLDGQGITELQMVTQFMRKGTNIPKATFVVLSGHGLHLYYVLEKPIRATMNNIRKLNKLKEGMTKLIWNRYTSNIDKIQFQYCLQGFRMVGSASKMGKRYPVRAYRFSEEHYTIEELVSWIPKLKEWDEYRIDMTEEEYREKREELGQIAARLHVNLDVLDLLEKDYRMRLIVLSLASYFGFEKITGGKLLKAACLEPKEGVNDIKAFFHKAGWMPYYLEYVFNDSVKTDFHDIAEFFFDDVELYMDMSEFLSYLRLPMSVRLI